MRNESPGRIRRSAVRAFVLTMAFIMILDITPWGVIPGDVPKKLLAQLTCRLGIEQGQWSMFAPNPATRTIWWTAEITDAAGEKTEWSSPYWATADGREKFLHYRYMIFDDRLSWPQFYPATADFSNFLAREFSCQDSCESREETREEGAAAKVILYSNVLELIRPDDGSMPTAESITFVASSEAVARSD